MIWFDRNSIKKPKLKVVRSKTKCYNKNTIHCYDLVYIWMDAKTSWNREISSNAQVNLSKIYESFKLGFNKHVSYFNINSNSIFSNIYAFSKVLHTCNIVAYFDVIIFLFMLWYRTNMFIYVISLVPNIIIFILIFYIGLWHVDSFYKLLMLFM